MPVAHLAAVKALNSAAVLLFLTLLLLAAAKRLSTIIVLFAVQSAVLAADVVAVAYVHRIPEAYAIAALVFLTKVIGIPSPCSSSSSGFRCRGKPVRPSVPRCRCPSVMDTDSAELTVEL